MASGPPSHPSDPAGGPTFTPDHPALIALADELLRWNRRINLTGHRDRQAVLDDLVGDALVLARHVRGGSLLDIGSGNGFPGLVLALALPEVAVSLLEPREKRCAWLKHAGRLLDLGGRLRVLRGRAAPGRQADPPGLAGRVFDTVTLRAVAGLEDSLALARPYLAPGGAVVLPRAQKDRGQAQNLGLSVVSYELAPPFGARILVMAEPT